MGCSHNQEGKQEAVRGSSKEKEEERKGGREERKEKKKGEEERKKKEEEEGVLRSEQPGRQRTRNCATRGRFPPILVILRLGVV